MVMAFLPGDSLLFVAGAVSALPAAQAKGLNVHLLAGLIIVGAVLGNTLNYFIGRVARQEGLRRHHRVDRPGGAEARRTTSTSATAA